MDVKKYLTIEEAQRLVPEVRRRILNVIKLNKAIEMISEIEIVYDDEMESMFSEIKFNRKFHSLCYSMFSHLESLMKRGAYLDNLDFGTVKFFSIHNGKPVILCWRIGDRHIKYWHNIDEDFTEKKPISKLR